MNKKEYSYQDLQEILWDYSNWLHKHGYIDSDYYCEEPHAVDEYLDTQFRKSFLDKPKNSCYTKNVEG